MMDVGQTYRKDAGKLRYDLLEPYAIQELVRVFTAGSLKYADNNWLKGGMKYSRMLASLQRIQNLSQRLSKKENIKIS